MTENKFKELTTEELSGLSAEDLAGYYNEFNKVKNAEFKSLIDSKASKEDIDQMRNELKEINDRQLKSLNDALAAQGLMIKKLSQTEEKKETKGSMRDQIKSGIEANIDQLKNFRNNKQKSFASFDVKVAGTMTTIANISGGNVPVEDREPGVNRLARRNTWVLDSILSGPTSSRVVSWVEQQNADGGAGGTVEGTAKSQADFDLVVVNETIKKRTVYIKISDEMLEDVDFMASEVETELMELLLLDIDNQLLNGDNVGQNLNGILTQATAWAAGTFASAIDNANNWDVLQVGINQIDIANREASVIFMHPSDVTAMKLTKGTDGHYVLPPFIAADGMQVDSLPVRANTGIAADNFLIMDGSKAKAFFREGIKISQGFENDDFTLNLVTILAEARLLLRIKGNDTAAFVTGVFSTSRAALETP